MALDVAHGLKRPRTPGDVAVLARRARWRDRLGRWFLHVTLCILSLPLVLPYLWLATAAFSTKASFGLVPRGFTLRNWRFLWESNLGFVSGTAGRLPNIWQVVANSLVLALGTTVVVVVVTTLAGYLVSRHGVKHRDRVLRGAMMLQAFPGVTLLVALFILLRTLGILNSLVGVLLVIASLHLPFALFVMKGFFDGIPWEVEMASMLDGASRLRTWYSVLLPQVRSGIGAVAIFAFLWGWTDYIFVLTFILRRTSWTMSLYLSAVIGEYRSVDYGLLAAVGVFYMIPSLVFFLLTQWHLVQITLGSAKA